MNFPTGHVGHVARQPYEKVSSLGEAQHTIGRSYCHLPLMRQVERERAAKIKVLVVQSPEWSSQPSTIKTRRLVETCPSGVPKGDD